MAGPASNFSAEIRKGMQGQPIAANNNDDLYSLRALFDALDINHGQMQGAVDSAEERFKRHNAPPPIAPDDFRGT